MTDQKKPHWKTTRKPPPAGTEMILKGAQGAHASYTKTTDKMALFRFYAKAYPADKLPSWGAARLWAMAEAESNRRLAMGFLQQVVIGSPERNSVLREIKTYQEIVDKNEKIIRDALKTKGPQTAAEKRDAAATDALENTEFGRKLKEAQGGGESSE